MSKVCPKCNRQFPDNIGYCAICGAQLDSMNNQGYDVAPNNPGLGYDVAPNNPGPGYNPNPGRSYRNSIINDSGTGPNAKLPAELQGLNWGACGLHWIWGANHKVWLSFLVFLLGFIWMIVLLIKGNEWAWQNRHFNSVEEFKEVQAKWAPWGIVFFVLNIICNFIWIACMASASY